MNDYPSLRIVTEYDLHFDGHKNQGNYIMDKLFQEQQLFLLLHNLYLEVLLLKNYWSSSVWWRIGFLRIFIVAVLLFLVPARGSNPAGQ